MRMREVAQLAADLTKTRGGVTLTPQGTNLAGIGGYAVSIYPEMEVTMKSIDADDFEYFLRRNRSLLRESGSCLGAWKDETTNVYYLDVVCVVDNLDEAKRLGHEWGQLAVFDLGKMEEIRL